MGDTPLEPVSASEAVILDKASQSQEKKKQSNAKIHHFFTFNNYSAEHIYIFQQVFDELCYMYAFQEETGENGTKHLQGIISLKKKMRWTEFGLPKGIHWEKPRDVKDSYLYCTKEKSRTGGVFVKNYTIPYTFKLENFYDWQIELLEALKKEPDNRKVNWYWSEEGKVGKSAFCKHMVMNHGAVLLTKGTYQDMCNLVYKSDMMISRIVIFDLPRNNGNKISYSAIESIKNGMVCNTKYETGFKCFPPPHIVVFANDEPDFGELSCDRWYVKKIG